MDEDPYSFKKMRKEIENALFSRIQTYSGLYSGEKDFELIDGYILQPYQPDLQGFQFGGQSYPFVGIVGRNTGRVYYFGLGAILGETRFQEIKKHFESNNG